MGSHLRYGYVCPSVLVHVVGVVVVIVLNSIVYIYNYIHCILRTYVMMLLFYLCVFLSSCGCCCCGGCGCGCVRRCCTLESV